MPENMMEICKGLAEVSSAIMKRLEVVEGLLRQQRERIDNLERETGKQAH